MPAFLRDRPAEQPRGRAHILHFSCSFVYGCYYLFFEAYPLVFGGIYNFSFQVEALGYLAFIVGGLIAFTTYVTYLAVRIGPIFARGQAPLPEQWLDPLLVSSVIAPMGIFLFAWTSRHAVHWIAPLFGVAVSNLTIRNTITSV